MADPLIAWMKGGKHLPDVLRDFHDQKDLFKAMHDLQQPSGPSELEAGAFTLDFVTGQCYVIDRFLWFMARRGYTLQRSRSRLPFRDLQADVKAATEKRDAHLAALLEAHVSGVLEVQGLPDVYLSGPYTVGAHVGQYGVCELASGRVLGYLPAGVQEVPRG